MLRLVAHGWRNFITDPDVSPSRLNWEFFAVTKGSCAPYFLKGPLPSLRKSTLWLMPPNLKYVWVGDKKPCFRVLFHIGQLPEIMWNYLREKKFFETPLTKAQGQHILTLAKEISSHFYSPDETYDLRITKLTAELCILILGNEKGISTHPLHLAALEKVQRAESYYKKHLKRKPTVSEVASIIGASESQMRRHFLLIRKKTPQDVFKFIRLHECTNLLAITNLTNDEIAARTGFASIVDFHRSFKKRFGVTPYYWRKHRHFPELFHNLYNFTTTNPPPIK